MSKNDQHENKISFPLKRQSDTKTGVKTENTNRIPGRPNPDRKLVKCQNCGREGHTAERCWQKQNQTFQKPDSTCFNCKDKGHRATDCPKKKIQCTKCKWYGHEADTCLGQKVKVIHTEKPAKQQGHVECKINEILLIGFIDSGSEISLMREVVAHELQLNIEPKRVPIFGYGNVSSGTTLGTVEVHLKLGYYEATVTVHVVPDNLQKEELLIGQNVLGRADLTAMTNQGNWWFIPTATDDSSPATLSPKRALQSPHAVEIPPKCLHMYKVTTNENNETSIYIEGGLRGRELYIPPCVTSTQGYVPVLNLSEKPVKVKSQQVIVRGVHAHLDPSMSDLKQIEGKWKPFTLDALNGLVEDNVKTEQKQQLLNIINEFRDCFAINLAELGNCNISTMEINLHDPSPVVYRPYRLSHKEREYVKEHVSELKQYGIIRDSESPYASPIILVKKKTGEQRMCCDFRRINAKTIRTQYPLPRVDDLIDQLTNASCLTSLDLSSGYWQINMDPQAVDKTAFITPDGHYEWLRMPFGLSNAPAVFQRVMNRVLDPIAETGAFAYIDDVLIPAKTINEGLMKLRKVLEALRAAGLTIRLDKCQFLHSKITYLGHEIENGQIRPGDAKIRAVTAFSPPKNVHEVRQFLGLASYFRKFIKDFSLIALPLTKLTRKDVTYQWGPAQQSAFDELKKKLAEKPVLAIYNPDAETEVHTDACKAGLAAICLQRQNDGVLKPILYYSQKTTPEEQRYHSYELETLAIVRALQRLRVYLYGKNFKLVTDCSALRYTLTKKDISPRIARWWLLIQEFTFTIEYRPGTAMRHVDSLSRNAIEKFTDSNIETIADQEVVNIRTVGIDLDDWITVVQTQDENCRQILEELTHKSNTPRGKEIRRDYLQKRGRIYRRTEHGLKWVVPRSVRVQVLRMYHDDAGHPGVAKTLELLRQRFWFPKMRKYVEDYARACLSCLYSKPNRGVSSGPLHPIPKPRIPMDTLHMDFLGPFVPSTRRNTHLLVTVDAFTKYCWLWPTKSTATRGVLTFLDQLIGTYGVPRRIIADRGTSFTSSEFKTYCQDKGIKVILTAVATPRAAGQVERMNAVILDKLISIIPEEKSWDKYLDQVKMSINNTMHESTKISPNELFFGSTLR